MATLRVSDLMSERVITVRADDDLNVLRELMIEHDVRHMPVVTGDGDLVGLVSHRDLLRTALIEQADVPPEVERTLLQRVEVGELMTEHVLTIDAKDDIRDAATEMFERKIGCLPVTDGARLVGILTEADFVRLMAHGD